MPSPIVHLAAGVLIARRLTRLPNGRHNRRAIWASALFFSMAPDLDAIPGLLTGNLSAYHNEATHSLFFGMAFCLIAAPGVRLFLDGWSFSRVYVFVLLCYLFHLALDLLTRGPGLKLFWPLTDERYSLPVTLFYGVRHSEGLLTAHHLITLANELLVVGVLVLVIRRASLPGSRNHPD